MSAFILLRGRGLTLRFLGHKTNEHSFYVSWVTAGPPLDGQIWTTIAPHLACT
jgi:hypothetical protein